MYGALIICYCVTVYVFISFYNFLPYDIKALKIQVTLIMFPCYTGPVTCSSVFVKQHVRKFEKKSILKIC